MFIMMNAARYSVGLEGIGLAERSTQRAIAYAKERIQGAELGASSRQKVAIIKHPDVRRMLLTMKSRTEALRAVACRVALEMDLAEHARDTEARAEHQAFVDLMIPVVKGWSTESAVEIASIGVQVHGGMGFVEETGAAQHLRDSRITPIYEGTTGIQAADLVGRKMVRDGGQAVGKVVLRMRDVATRLGRADDAGLKEIGDALGRAVDVVEQAVRFLIEIKDPREAAAVSVPFLELFGIVTGAWQLALSAEVARSQVNGGQGNRNFLTAKVATVRFYVKHVLPRASALALQVVEGAASVLDVNDDQI